MALVATAPPFLADFFHALDLTDVFAGAAPVLAAAWTISVTQKTGYLIFDSVSREECSRYAWYVWVDWLVSCQPALASHRETTGAGMHEAAVKSDQREWDISFFFHDFGIQLA